MPTETSTDGKSGGGGVEAVFGGRWVWGWGCAHETSWVIDLAAWQGLDEASYRVFASAGHVSQGQYRHLYAPSCFESISLRRCCSESCYT